MIQRYFSRFFLLVLLACAGGVFCSQSEQPGPSEQKYAMDQKIRLDDASRGLPGVLQLPRSELPGQPIKTVVSCPQGALYLKRHKEKLLPAVCPTFNEGSFRQNIELLRDRGHRDPFEAILRMGDYEMLAMRHDQEEGYQHECATLQQAHKAARNKLLDLRYGYAIVSRPDRSYDIVFREEDQELLEGLSEEEFNLVAGLYGTSGLVLNRSQQPIFDNLPERLRENLQKHYQVEVPSTVQSIKNNLWSFAKRAAPAIVAGLFSYWSTNSLLGNFGLSNKKLAAVNGVAAALGWLCMEKTIFDLAKPYLHWAG